MDVRQGADVRGTASALHRFNRYEIKYLVRHDELARFREELSERTTRDPRQAEPTRVTSVYYDTASLRFYWEKIEGLRFRRKLRIRAYGAPTSITDDTHVFVEIKQRVNRVTQKRRVQLPYPEARRLCDRRERIDSPSSEGFIGEVLTLCQSLDLRPTAVTTYFRDGYMGEGSDLGLRITVDQRVSGRDRDFSLGATSKNVFILPPHLALVELKVNERVPTWFTDLAARQNMTTVRVSKYCKAIEAHSLGVRSAQHQRDLPVETTT